MAIDFPTSPTVGQQYTYAGITYTYTAQGVWSARSSVGVPVTTLGGRLEYVSATALKFAPYNGNQIKINGVIYTIPNAGIAGLGNTGVFVNGSTGNLAANATYWVTAFNSGTVTAHYWSGATHATSMTAGNEGVEIITGNDAYSLIGMCRTNASAQFVNSTTQRFVLSWFNRNNLSVLGASTNGTGTTSASLVELGTAYRIELLCWNEAIAMGACGYMFAGGLATTACSVGIDGTAIAAYGGAVPHHTSAAASYYGNASHEHTATLAEGYHYLTPMGACSGGVTGAFYVTAHATIRG